MIFSGRISRPADQLPLLPLTGEMTGLFPRSCQTICRSLLPQLLKSTKEAILKLEFEVVEWRLVQGRSSRLFCHSLIMEAMGRLSALVAAYRLEALTSYRQAV